MPTGSQGPGAAETRKVTVVADDLTGATDTVVQFRQAGWDAYLLLTDAPEEAEEGASAVAVSRSLDTRPLARPEAAARTHRAVANQLAADADRLYLKIDSTMRGSVAGQVEGALRAWSAINRDAVAVICPAYPQMGRVITEGSMLVNGVPLDQSPAGFDPVTPVATSLLTELLPGSSTVPNHGSAAELAEALAGAADETDRLVVDAASEEDLRRLAEAVEVLGTRAVCVGSAGLARHLAEVWRPAGSPSVAPNAAAQVAGATVVSVSSLNEVSFEQIAHLAGALGDRLEQHQFTADQLSDPAAMRALGSAIVANGDGARRVVLVAPSPDRIPGMEAAEAARSVAGGLAAAIGGMVRAGGVGALVLVGGDGAQAALNELGAVALRIERQASEGVPLGRIVGGPAAGLLVVTKAGGFGRDSTLTDVINDLHDPQEV